MDGYASGWMRGPLILQSNSVPIVVETDYTPLGFDSWLPWYHYVPVRKDLSDLVKNIQWLKDNDSEALKIALNG